MIAVAGAAEVIVFFWALGRIGAGSEGAAKGGKSCGSERPGGTDVATGVDFLGRGPIGGKVSGNLRL